MQEACPPPCNPSVASARRRGGVLVADEDCGGFELECKGEVNNNGYDVSIKPQTTILFANSSARINMDGSFYSGSSSESRPLYLKAKSGGAWRGLKLSNCEDALLRNTVFENISPYPVDSTYALELTDCGIPGSQFARLVDNEFRTAGKYAVEFSGASLARGVYFCRMEAGKFAVTGRMILLK